MDELRDIFQNSSWTWAFTKQDYVGVILDVGI